MNPVSRSVDTGANSHGCSLRFLCDLVPTSKDSSREGKLASRARLAAYAIPSGFTFCTGAVRRGLKGPG